MRGKTTVVILTLLLATLALAQTAPTASTPAPGMPQHRMERRAGPPAGGMAMPMNMGNLMRPPMELLGEWWKNPELANELRLTDAQVKQLEDSNLKTKLSLIDTGADGLKALVRLQTLLDADQLDEAAYNQQVTALSSDAANLVKTFGQTALTIRRVLSAEQWKKLEALRHMHRPPMPPGPMGPEHPMPRQAPAPPPQGD